MRTAPAGVLTMYGAALMAGRRKVLRPVGGECEKILQIWRDYSAEKTACLC